MDSTKKSLHYSTYLSNFLKSMKSNILPLGVGLFIMLKDGFSIAAIKDNGFIFIILLFTIFSAMFSMVEAKITKYWIEDDKIMMQKGIFNKTVKEIYIGKIQTMDTSAGVANQLLGGVIMHIKTAGDGIELNSIGKHDAKVLSDYLNQRKYQLNHQEIADADNISETVDTYHPEDKEVSYETLYELSFKDLILMSSTSASMFTALAVFFGIYSQIDEVLSLDHYFNRVEEFVGDNYIMLGIIIAGMLFISYIIGIFITSLKYHRYTVRYDGEVLNIKYGLFERKNKYIVVNNIQKVSERQSYLRKLFNKTSFSVTTTSEMKDSEDSILGDEELLPFISRDEAYHIIQSLVPGYQFNEVNHIIPKRSIRRYFQVSWVVIIVICSVIQYYWFDKAWIIGLILLILTLITAWIKYKNSGYKISDNQITIRNGGVFSMETSFIRESNIISLDVNTTPFMNRADLRSISIDVSSGSMSATKSLDYIEKEDAKIIYDWFLAKERRQYE